MRVSFLVFLVSLAWSVIQAPKYFKQITAAKSAAVNNIKIPNVEDPSGKQQETDPSMPKQTLNMTTPDMQDKLKELGVDENFMSVDVYSPALVLKEKLEKNAKNINVVADVFGKAKAYAAFGLVYLNDNAAAWLIALAVLIFLLKVIELWPVLRFVSGTCFAVSQVLLFLVSFGALAVVYYFKINIWDYSVVFYFPLGLLLISPLGLKFLDMNFPIWNRIYSGLFFPVISGILITGIKVLT
jgi:hypothetical protein